MILRLIGLNLITGRILDSSTSISRIEKIGDRLTMIGTIHVDPASAKLAYSTILRLRPQVVALELDEARLAALARNHRGNSLVGGFSFLVMMLLERFAGEVTGSAPGAEMLQAVEAARNVGSQVQFVDLPIWSTISSIRKLSLSEKVKLGLDSLISMIFLPFARPDFSRLTEDIENQIRMFRQRYPELARILIDQREEYMANRIQSIMDSTTGPVVVVVGYGHMKSLARRLEMTRTRQGFSSTLTWTLPG